ncbi:MAG TPA: nitrilase, partial [Sphingorhabdus sp.]|nr:nitrilase [Sphingorhabdus sp.]
MELERRQALGALVASALPLSVEAAPLADGKTYAAVALQFAARSVERTPDRAAARKQMLETIAALGPKIRSGNIFIQQYGGAAVKLAVLPEYFLTSYPG